MRANPVESWDDLPSEHRYRLLLQITDLVDRHSELSDAFEEFAPPLLDVTSSDFLSVSLHDPHHDCMLTSYWKKNRESGEFDDLAVDTAASGWTWKHQETITIDDVEGERRFPGCMPLLFDQGVRSYTLLPMSTRSRHFGALGLGRSVRELVSREDVEFLSRVALLGAGALEKEKAYESFEEQRSLLEISRELSSSLELANLLPTLLASVRHIARYERAVLSLLDDEGKNVQLFGEVREWEPMINHGKVVPIEQALSGRAIQSKNAAFFTAADLREMKAPLAKAMSSVGISIGLQYAAGSGRSSVGGVERKQ